MKRSALDTERRREAPTQGHFREYGADRYGAGEYGADRRGEIEYIRNGEEAQSAGTGPLRTSEVREPIDANLERQRNGADSKRSAGAKRRHGAT